MKDNIKDGLKWIVLVFAVALLVLLLVTQKDKFMKVVDESAVTLDGQVSDEVVTAKEEQEVEEESDESTKVETFIQDEASPANASVEFDKNGIEIAPR